MTSARLNPPAPAGAEAGGGRTLAGSSPTAASRFWAMVNRTAGPDACWPWTGARNRHGDGVAPPDVARQAGSRSRLAHRVAWVLANGPIPPRRCILRVGCWNRTCVNPAHSIAGTYWLKRRLVLERGRERHARGEDAATSKLNRDQVRVIRKSPLSNRQLGALYGVNHKSIHAIKSRRNWAWLPD